MLDTMAQAPTKLAEKLAQLTHAKDMPKLQIAREIGVSHQQFGYYLAGESVPGVGPLGNMARYFGVSLEWLLDDDLPVDQPTNSIQLSSDEDLMAEAAKRYTERYLKIMGYLDRAEAIDWESFAQQLQDYSIPSQPLYTLPSHSKYQAQLDVLFVTKANFLQDILDPCDSASLAFRISKFSGGKLPVEVDSSATPARMFIFQRIDAIHRRALTTEHAQSVFRWAMSRATWEDESLSTIEKALKACGV